MATTPNYGWVTPAPTDFVTDLPADFEIFADAVDASFAADEGDLLVGGTSNIFEPLPIGAAGTVLTSDGDTAEWVAPAAPPAAGSDWTLLNTGGTALTGADTVTVSGISDKDKIMVLIIAASSASASSFIGVRLNGETGSIYRSVGNFIEAGSTYVAGNFSQLSGVVTRIDLGRMSNVASGILSGGVTFTGCNSSGNKQYNGNGGGLGATSRLFNFQGYVDLSDTITSVSAFSGSGNFDSGTLYVYASA